MIAISDGLLKEYFEFQKGNVYEYDTENISKLLKYMMPMTISTYQKEQLNLSDELVKMFSDGNIIRFRDYIDEKEHIQNTKFKIMLTNSSDKFPYINIFDDKIDVKYSGTFYKNENRDKAQKHIKALLENSNELIIYDDYLKTNWQDVKKFFELLVPKKRLNLYFLHNHIGQNIESDLKSICPNWQIKKFSQNRFPKIYEKYNKLHDRYLVIDNNVEIIFTSGYDYLFDNYKDFTYIINEIK